MSKTLYYLININKILIKGIKISYIKYNKIYYI